MVDGGMPPVVGVIGGSGVYEIDGLEDIAWRHIETPKSMAMT